MTKWVQEIAPVSGIVFSALIAAIPIVFIFWALIIKKMKGYKASILTALIALIIAIAVYGMPVKLALLSTFHGVLYGFFPICWIIIGAVFLYNVTVKSGQFEIIKNFIATITGDRRLQALLIAFSFGAFLEGSAGFGTPVAISAAMLAGLGYNPLYAAGICLIANTSPVAFGAIGTPIIIASQITGIPEMAISQMVGRTLPVLSFFVPLYLVVLMSGFRKSLEVMPAILISGLSFALMQWYASNYLSPMLPDIIAGLVSLACLTLFLKFWKPRSVWRFSEEPQQTIDQDMKYSAAETIRAWSPFIIMTVMIIAWGLQPVKDALNFIGQVKFNIPGLTDSIIKQDGSPLIIKPFDLNLLSSPGSAVLLSGLLSLPLVGMSMKDGFLVLIDTVKQLRYPFITITSVLGFAFIANYSGMSVTMAVALASTGFLFPFFSPVLGWLGVFLTGSDTSSNALFCKLQQTTATEIGIDPVITVSANATGGVTGKMISPQSIAVGAASVGLVGRESDLFRFTLKHSFIMLFLICVITVLQAYVIKWIVPVYTIPEKEIAAQVSGTSSGITYLLFLLAMLSIIAFTVILMNRKKENTHNSAYNR
jgi:lactate permease